MIQARTLADLDGAASLLHAPERRERRPLLLAQLRLRLGRSARQYAREPPPRRRPFRAGRDRSADRAPDPSDRRAGCGAERWTSPRAPRADALVTDRPGVALGVMAADLRAGAVCAELEAQVIGAAHAGWKGPWAASSTPPSPPWKARRPARACARAIGPCIGAASYEVGPEFPALPRAGPGQRHASGRPSAPAISCSISRATCCSAWRWPA